MRQLTADTHFYLYSLIFLYSVVQNLSVAPSIPDSYAIFSPPSSKHARKLLDSIVSCPEKCHCYVVMHKLRTDCSVNELQSVPPSINSSTHELLLFQNKLSSLSYNVTLSELEVLNVSENHISFVEKKWIESLINLKILDISQNQLHSGVGNLFSKLPLHVLNLSYNKFTEIGEGMFQGLHHLQELDLSNNRIRKIDGRSFFSLKSLIYLDISSNELIDLKHEWFDNMKNLKILNLRRNNLQKLSNAAFWHLKNLEYLDVSENLISSIGLLSFKDLLKLQSLNISHNSIGVVQKGVFRFLEKVEIIDLSNNPLQSLDETFAYSKNLEILLLKHLSKFKSLTATSLSGLTQLKILDMSGSKSLSYINRRAFISVKNLESLDVSNSNLSSLEGVLFKELRKLETIKLKGNPWHCDCYLYWMLIWLSEHPSTHLLSPTETICHSPQNLRNKVLLDTLDHDIVCTNASIQKYTKHAEFGVGSTALLQCEATGSPIPSITWITPQKHAFHSLANNSDCSYSENCSLTPEHPTIHSYDGQISAERFLVMKNGDLLIKDIERGDGGFYVCVASNPLNNQSVAIRLMLDYRYLVHIKIISILVGLATSFGFLLFTLVSVLVMMILKRCGVRCPCRNGKSSPKAQQIRKILESMEHYKKQQLERLRENYNFQVQRIKDNCMQQMERLRESYSSQAERLKDIRDYGTLQIDRIRENYYCQVQRVRDYSTCQIERLRENYIFQRNRIRKFSTHHLYKLRENYKVQQQHLNRILENLNLESCRNVCQRTDSVVFEPDITLENVFVPKICLAESFSKNIMDSVDNSSQVSAYFTPEEACSEVSGHESDSADCIQNYTDEMESPSSFALNIPTEAKEKSSDASVPAICIAFGDKDKTAISSISSMNINETIV